jgi:hypothetical protein
MVHVFEIFRKEQLNLFPEVSCAVHGKEKKERKEKT